MNLIERWHELAPSLPASGIRCNRDEAPQFDAAPSPEHFATEQRWFPRSDERMPRWFREGLTGANA